MMEEEARCLALQAVLAFAIRDLHAAIGALTDAPESVASDLRNRLDKGLARWLKGYRSIPGVDRNLADQIENEIALTLGLISGAGSH
jgi:hypothetical protein